ncbi:hypothetical protein Ancab_010943 [Ancistrocladus abbreviatus]
MASIAFAAMPSNLAPAAATNYTVGAPGGSWALATNFQQWASSTQFLVGDTLVFQYTAMHDVVEVPKPDYDLCQMNNPIQADSSGLTIIPLDHPGKSYFICSTPGHCSQGMKLEVDTLKLSTFPPSKTTSSSLPSFPTPSTSQSTASPTTSPSAAYPSTSPSPSPLPSTSSADSLRPLIAKAVVIGAAIGLIMLRGFCF